MATLSKGFTFVDGQQLTAARLNSLVDSATISGILQSDFGSTASCNTIADVAPSSPSEGWVWVDTSFGATEAKIRMYDGSQWILIAEGVVAYNSGVSTILAGSLVKVSAAAGGTGNMRLEVAVTSSKHDSPAGVVLGDIPAGSTGVIVTKGRVLGVKSTGSIVAGDFVVPSSTSATATTSADANFGQFYGSGVCGIWTKTGSGSTNEAYLFPPAKASGISFRTPSKLINGATPGTNDTWSGSFGSPAYITWSATPPGVIARLVQWRVRAVSAVATVPICFGLRQASSGLDISTGTVHFTGAIVSDNGSASNDSGFAGQAWLPTNPAGDGTDRAEYLVRVATNATIAQIRVDIWEVGVVAGGRIV